MLQKGANPNNNPETARSDEQQRDAQRGIIIYKLRRYWRILCLIMLAYYSVGGLFAGGGIGYVLSVVVGIAAIYAIVTIVVLYIFGGWTIKFVLYMRDLISSKNTKL